MLPWAYIHGTDLEEVLLFPPSLDEYILPENPVRFIDAFVDSLDLADLGFTRATPAHTGRPGYGPALLLKLYLNCIRSSRLLEREAHRNIELLWLLKKLAPDFKTVAGRRRVTFSTH